jgi:hypothetical protein
MGPSALDRALKGLGAAARPIWTEELSKSMGVSAAPRKQDDATDEVPHQAARAVLPSASPA